MYENIGQTECAKRCQQVHAKVDIKYIVLNAFSTVGAENMNYEL